MSLKQTKSRGFTIVELLIVIVVIAILAAITIVAYNGIQNRAKQSAAQSLANTIIKKAEAYNTIESTYPTYAQLTSNNGNGTAGNPAEAKLDNASVVSDAGATGTALTVANEKSVQYKKCTTGAIIYYYDAVNNKKVGEGIGGQPDVATATTAC